MLLDLKFLSLKRFTRSLRLLWLGRSLSGSVDNTVLNSGTGGDTIASDDIAGVKYQRVKVVFGADGSATDASSTNPLPADVINALPAGDNNIGNIDVLTVITGTGATNLGKAEDAVHASGDTGVLALGVRIDTANSSLVSTASDYSPLQVDQFGRLWTHVGVTDANSGVDIGDVDVLSIAAGDNNIGNVDVLTVIAGTGATNLGKAEDAAHSSGDTGVSALAVRITNANASLVSAASDYSPLLVDDQGKLWTRLREIETPAGDTMIDDSNDALRVTNTTVVSVQGYSAGQGVHAVHSHHHDAAVATAYVGMIGAEARTTNPTAVANADVVRLTADTSGRLITQPFGPRGIVRTGYWQFSTASEVALIGSAGAGVFSDLIHLSISNSSTQTNGIPIVTIRDSIGGATRYAFAVATAGGGVILNFPYPVPQTTAANSWTAHPNIAQATIYVMMMTIDRV